VDLSVWTPIAIVPILAKRIEDKAVFDAGKFFQKISFYSPSLIMESSRNVGLSRFFMGSVGYGGSLAQILDREQAYR
jgi:hypothetical protein